MIAMKQKISAETVLRLLVRTAQQFLAFAWEALGEEKKIINVTKK